MKTVSSYALDLICLTPNIKPGDPIKIEIFIVGKGSLNHNKMIINYPISLIDEKDPGFIEHCIGIYSSGDLITGKPYLEKQGDKARHKLTREGVYYIFNKGYFREYDESSIKIENAIPRVQGEIRHDGIPPCFMKLNTSKKTLPGDYEINFNFTYVDNGNIYLNKKTIKIHVKNKIEIYGIYGLIVSIIAFVFSLSITRVILDYLYNLLIKIIMYIIDC